jgi:predicted nucleic acid-binding protein
MPDPGPQGPVVCNTGPLIALCKINRVHLLPRLFGQVLVPAEVVGELSSATRLPEAHRILSTPGIASATLANPPERMLLMELEAGEAAVIALALERGISQVLIDEKKARRVASMAYKLEVLGTGGLLLKAKRYGLVSAVRPLLEEMKQKGYFLSDRLVHGICLAAGE